MMINDPVLKKDILLEEARQLLFLISIYMVIVIGMLFIPSFSAQAASITEAEKIENQINRDLAESQKVVDKSAHQADIYKKEIESLKEEINNLTVYRDHLGKLVASQEKESEELTHQLNIIQQTKKDIVPLMYNMLSGLEALIEQDKPIKIAEREARLNKLKQMMGQADINNSEKYRRLLEAYQIELDYGSELSRYQAQIQIEDSEVIDVDLLYLGRIAFIARRFDGTEYWSWNDDTHQWESIDSSYYSQLETAYDMGSKQLSPSLLTLPVSLDVSSSQLKGQG